MSKGIEGLKAELDAELDALSGRDGLKVEARELRKRLELSERIIAEACAGRLDAESKASEAEARAAEAEERADYAAYALRTVAGLAIRVLIDVEHPGEANARDALGAPIMSGIDRICAEALAAEGDPGA